MEGFGEALFAAYEYRLPVLPAKPVGNPALQQAGLAIAGRPYNSSILLKNKRV